MDTVVNLDSKFFNDYNLGHKSLYICAKFILCSHILLIIFAEYIFIEYVFILHNKMMQLR